MGSRLAIKFWGTRGIIPSPRKSTAIYGGNTSCIEVIAGSNPIIVDAGFGICHLGETFPEAQPLEVHILFTHLHWDHIQGLPFFNPIYFPETHLHLHSPLPITTLKSELDILFDGSYSPFRGIDKMPAKITFHQIESNYNVSGLDVSFIELQHSLSSTDNTPCYGYKFEETISAKKVAIITDHEAYKSPTNQKVINFITGSDLIVHDGQYTHEEYQDKKGWGHSSMDEAINNISAANGQHGILTHHAPHRNDDELDQLQRNLQNKHPEASFEFAKEHMLYEVNFKSKKTG